jgi:hypothetical protein
MRWLDSVDGPGPRNCVLDYNGRSWEKKITHTASWMYDGRVMLDEGAFSV